MARVPKKTNAIAFWLVPAKAEYELFEEIIRILAVELNAPQFEPHLTICAAPDKQGAHELLRQLSAESIRLRVRNVSYSNDFIKTLFVRFEPSSALNELSASLRRATKLSRVQLRDPHVSLLYKRMPMSAKKDLASTIKLPFREVIFDSIKAVRCISPTTTPVDVESWRVVATKSLSG